MHAQGRLSFARLLAPVALIAVTVAVLAIILGSGVVGDSSSSEQTDATGVTATTERKTKKAPQRKKRTPATYTIKANDTLSAIAIKNGTTVERLLELNPQLDPQSLVAGQQIKLRE